MWAVTWIPPRDYLTISRVLHSCSPFRQTANISLLWTYSGLQRQVSCRCWIWTSLFMLHSILPTLFLHAPLYSFFSSSLDSGCQMTLFFFLSFLNLAVLLQIPSPTLSPFLFFMSQYRKSVPQLPLSFSWLSIPLHFSLIFPKSTYLEQHWHFHVQ